MLSRLLSYHPASSSYCTSSLFSRSPLVALVVVRPRRCLTTTSLHHHQLRLFDGGRRDKTNHSSLLSCYSLISSNNKPAVHHQQYRCAATFIRKPKPRTTSESMKPGGDNKQQQQITAIKEDKPPSLRVNAAITGVEQVRLVTQNAPGSATTSTSEIVSWNEALVRAANAKLDLIEVSPKAKPPVVKLMSLVEFKKGALPVQPAPSVAPRIPTSQLPPPSSIPDNSRPIPPLVVKTIVPVVAMPPPPINPTTIMKDAKELVFGTSIGDHDFNRQVDRLREFLKKRYPVKVTLKFKRSRSLAIADRPAKADEIVKKIESMITDLAMPGSNREINRGFVRYFHPKGISSSTNKPTRTQIAGEGTPSSSTTR